MFKPPIALAGVKFENPIESELINPERERTHETI